jgi:hypothetical protein
MSKSYLINGSVREKRPLGVWILTVVDGLVLGFLIMILAGVRAVGFVRLYTGFEDISRSIGGIALTFAAIDVFFFLWGLLICLVARGAWLGRDRARISLVMFVTFSFFVAARVDVIVLLANLVLIPIHWWYFWRPSTLAFYDRS